MSFRSQGLQLTFGIVADTLSRDLLIGLVTLLSVLRTGCRGLGRICLASVEEQIAAADYLHVVHPFPPGLRVWAFCDGTVFRVLSAPFEVRNKMLYSGFHQMLCVSCVLLILFLTELSLTSRWIWPERRTTLMVSQIL